MTFPVMPLRHVFCIMALMLSCSSVAVFADEGTRDPQPAITKPTAAAFSGLGSGVKPVSHSSPGSVPHGAGGTAPGPGVTGNPIHSAIPGIPGAQPIVSHHLDGNFGSHPGGANAVYGGDSVTGVSGVDARPHAGVLFPPVSSKVHPGPGVNYNSCNPDPVNGESRTDSNCVPNLQAPASPSVVIPGQRPASGAAALIPGVPGVPGSPSGALLSKADAGVGGQPGVGDNFLTPSKARQHLLKTNVAPVTARVGVNAPAAIPGFPNGYSVAGVTGPVHPTTPLGSHPGAGPVVSQHNDQVPGAASGPSGGKGNQAGSTVAASPPEESAPANNQSGGKQDADAVSVVQPSSQPPTAPAQSESTTDTPNSSNTKESQSTTTGTTTVPPVTANSKKPKGKGDANSSRISSVWVRVPLLIVVALATVLVC